jgi:hypothetical protein
MSGRSDQSTLLCWQCESASVLDRTGSYQLTSELMRLTKQLLDAAKRGCCPFAETTVNIRTNARTHSYQETTNNDNDVAQTRALEQKAQAIRKRSGCRTKEQQQ